ncbi:hypothetical protein HAX54_010992 [Datura stramonium]|uniref:Uncharacterized protein n=1 Tax=Datura stramonium TaxID=4076 RepID=A0ABS8TH76_DATST|nr:hypothetical protein [Datura stramonium]
MLNFVSPTSIRLALVKYKMRRRFGFKASGYCQYPCFHLGVMDRDQKNTSVAPVESHSAQLSAQADGSAGTRGSLPVFHSCNADPQSEISQQKNKSCRPGAGVTREVMARHTSDSGSDGCQPGDRTSLVPSRCSPLNLWATEVLTDCQVSDGPSRKPSLRPKI